MVVKGRVGQQARALRTAVCANLCVGVFDHKRLSRNEAVAGLGVTVPVYVGLATLRT